ncbi:MAG TPA: hypothetical protein VGA37_17525 [Gemmatimonadales bacterium]
MIGGCLKNLFAMVGCATLLVVGGIVAYQYRDQIAGAVQSVRERGGGRADTAAGPTVGLPSGEALASAQRKEAEIGRRGGAGFVVLTADEMASLIEAGLDPVARRALDSLRVVLDDDRFTLQAQLRTDIFGGDLLGPIAGLLEAREPLELAGPAAVNRPGSVAWKPDYFRIRSFPFPQLVVPKLVDRLTGRTDGIVPIIVPTTVGDVRIRGSRVTFYRRTD